MVVVITVVQGPGEMWNDYKPQIAVAASGNSYVTWHGSDGNDMGIYWVRIDGTETPGTVKKISVHPEERENKDWLPKIALDASGNSYITWYGSDGSNYDIYWVKISNSGTPEMVRKISTHEDNINHYDSNPQSTIDASGNSYGCARFRLYFGNFYFL
ncbi:MAG: hypothetical protein AYK18_12740 [Theionarchaea archaeon DG-70]|nr:MAG: hypothetical protein AYK18_12740 [Theionarchaea archaeon DG-70]